VNVKGFAWITTDYSEQRKEEYERENIKARRYVMNLSKGAAEHLAAIYNTCTDIHISVSRQDSMENITEVVLSATAIRYYKDQRQSSDIRIQGKSLDEAVKTACHIISGFVKAVETA
jgi:hypothetical protein